MLVNESGDGAFVAVCAGQPGGASCPAGRDADDEATEAELQPSEDDRFGTRPAEPDGFAVTTPLRFAPRDGALACAKLLITQIPIARILRGQLLGWPP